MVRRPLSTPVLPYIVRNTVVIGYDTSSYNHGKAMVESHDSRPYDVRKIRAESISFRIDIRYAGFEQVPEVGSGSGFRIRFWILGFE